MKATEINKQETENRLEDILSKIYNYDSLEFCYLPTGDTTYLWMEFNTTMPCVDLVFLDSVKRKYKKLGFKVTQIVVYPMANCQISFRIIFQF